ncbi:MAG: S8 family serine peptidase [Clostridiales bacterium]|nr:S8 family serine peptidase [Clostridiales bacterium]
MKKTFKAFISALCAMALLISFYVSGFSASAFKGYSYSVQTSDRLAYCSALREMIEKSEKASAMKSKPDASGGMYASKRIIIKTDGTMLDISGFGASSSIKGPDDTYVLFFDSEKKAEECVKKAEGYPYVKFAEPDGKEKICETIEKDGPDIKRWGQERIGSDIYASEIAPSCADNSVVVAVVDTGVAHHTDLNGRMTAGKDLVDGDDNPDDLHSHGTHVAGIIAGNTKNLSNIKIMSVRVLDENGEGETSVLASGIKYAVDNGADVINLSVTGPDSKEKADAVNYAVDRGVIFVTAAGNGENNRGINVAGRVCPADMPCAIVVGSADSLDGISSFSNYGETIDIAAPGEFIYSTGLNNDYTVKSGTSMASAFGSAAAAMYKLSHPSADQAATESFLTKNARDLGEPGFDPYFGYGEIDLTNAREKSDFTTKIKDKKVYITGYTGGGDSLTIPSEIDGEKIYGIGKNAFSDMTGIRTVCVSDGVEYIGDGAFSGCASLSDVSFPDSLTAIGEKAFWGCPLLSFVTVPPGCSSIGDKALGYVSGPDGEGCIPVAGFTLKSYGSTRAESYANENGFKFILDELPLITADSYTLYLESGSTYKIKITVKNGGGVKPVWTSDDRSLVSVDENGKLTAGKGTGKTTVHVTVGKTEKEFTVNVVSKALTLSETNIVLRSHLERQLTASIKQSGYDIGDIVWTSSDPKKASVDGGVVTGIREGTAIVTASTKDGAFSASCTVTVRYEWWQWFIIIFLFGWIWYIR